MYTSFHIKNFRCFEDLEFNDLARINLIGGRNNVGKTSVLEALFIHGGAYNPNLTLSLKRFRGVAKFTYSVNDPIDSPWSSLFRNFDVLEAVELSGTMDELGNTTVFLADIHDADKLSNVLKFVQASVDDLTDSLSTAEPVRVLELRHQSSTGEVGPFYLVVSPQEVFQAVPPPSPFSTVIIPSRAGSLSNLEAERYSDLKLRRQHSIVLEILKTVEPRLKSLTTILKSGETSFYGELSEGDLDRLIPLHDMGDGLTRLLVMVLAIGHAQGGTVLIDEIENGLHYSTHADVWQGIYKAAQTFNVQVFATTHSLETIRAAHQAFQGNGDYDFRYHRLDRDPDTDNISVMTYDQELMEAATDLAYEVR